MDSKSWTFGLSQVLLLGLEEVASPRASVGRTNPVDQALLARRKCPMLIATGSLAARAVAARIWLIRWISVAN